MHTWIHSLNQLLKQTKLTRQVGLCLLLTNFLLGACDVTPKLTYTEANITPRSLTIPEGYYHDIVWLQDNILALQYSESLETETWQTQLMIYDYASGERYFLLDEVPAECRETRYGRMGRLPNAQLAYLYECFSLKGSGRDFRLHTWDIVTQTDREIYRYPIPFWPTELAFAPDGQQWLQEEEGDGLNNTLYWVQLEKEPFRLLEQSFARVGWPSWLPNGQIFFAGTPFLPDEKPNIFSGLPNLTRRMTAPWNIYQTDLASLLKQDVGEDDIVFSGIVDFGGPFFSPRGDRFVFWGQYAGQRGLWLYSLHNHKLVHLLARGGPLTWLPDGKQIVILQEEIPDDYRSKRPVIIDIPDTLQ